MPSAPVPLPGSVPATSSLIPGISTDPTTLFNNIATATQLLLFVASLLQQLASTGGIAVPGVPGVGLGAEGELILTLLKLVTGLLTVV